MVFVLTQGLLIQADSVSTPYAYGTCLVHATTVGGETRCEEYGEIQVQSASLIPPFTYNNQCGSTVLSSFIPVLLLGYSIQVMLPFVVLALVLYVPHSSTHPVVRLMLHGLLWPEQWVQGGEVLARNKALVVSRPDMMLRTRAIFCNDVLNNWLLMVTFGLCSPALAVAIVCSVWVHSCLWVVMIGRFTRRVLPINEEVDDVSNSTNAVRTSTTSNCACHISSVEDASSVEARCFTLVALASAYIPMNRVLASSFWRLAWCSALFVALLGWDLAADEVGWWGSLWVPMLPLGWLMAMHCVAYRFFKVDGATASELDIRTVATSQISDVSRSPFHIDGALRGL